MNPPLYFAIGHNQTQIQGRISNIIYLVPSLKQAKKKKTNGSQNCLEKMRFSAFEMLVF